MGWDKGATWNRTDRRWQAKRRGPLLPFMNDPGAGQSDTSVPGPGDPGPGDGGTTPDRDPDPAWGQQETRPLPEFKVDDEARKDIKALIALAYTVPGEVLPLADPYCFGPLAERDTADGVIDAVSDIVCGSPRVAKWAASATGLMPWLKLGIALKPVAVAALHHHVLRDVKTEVDRKNKTMTVTKRDWSEYSAA